MERHFALPVAFAAALHGALSFGFDKEPRVASDKTPATIIRPFELLPPRDEPEPVEVVAGDARPATVPDRPQPVTSPEPAAVAVDRGFVIEVPPFRFEPTENMTKIVETLPGVRGPGGENLFGPGAISIASLDKTPAARLQTPPLYPHEAKTQGLAGEVHVEFVVDGAGSVVEARALHASSRVFQDAAVRAVLKWKFEPGRKNGRIVSFRMVVPVVFNLNE